MTALERAAVAWWRSRRPIVFDLDEHLRHPTINTVTRHEKRLAMTTAKLVAKNRRTKGPR